MEKDQMTIEQIAVQNVAAILSNPVSITIFPNKETMMHDVVMSAIAYAKELKKQLASDASINCEHEQVTIDADFEIIK